MEKASLIAGSLNTARISSLTGNRDDVLLPEYNRLKDYLATSFEIENRFINFYILGPSEDQRPVFLMEKVGVPESHRLASTEKPMMPENSCCTGDPEMGAVDLSICSHPGDSYDLVSSDFQDILKNKKPKIVGPYQGKSHKIFTFFVPIFKPRNGQVLAVFAADISATKFYWNNLKEVRGPFFITFLALILYLLFRFLIKRGTVKKEYKTFVNIIIAGCTITFFITNFVYKTEEKRLMDDFIAITAQDYYRFFENISTVRDIEIESIVTILRKDNDLNHEFFHKITGYLERNSYIDSWAWVPLIKEEEKASFLAMARRDFQQDFHIWQWENEGEKEAAKERAREREKEAAKERARESEKEDDLNDICCPLLFALPHELCEKYRGFDFFSHPNMRKAISHAIKNRLLTATDNLCEFPDYISGKTGIFTPVITEAVAGESHSGTEIKGFIVSFVDFEHLFRKNIAKTVDGPLTNTAIISTSSDEKKKVLFSTGDYEKGKKLSVNQKRLIHIFGKTWIFYSWPGTAFRMKNPIYAIPLLFLLCLSLVFFSALFAYTQARTRRILQYLVRRRTKQLVEKTKKLKLETQRANENAQIAIKANQAKNLFLTNMSHELRTPLNGVFGGVQLLRESSINVEQSKWINIIHASGQSLLAQIDQILDYSFLGSGKATLNEEDFELNGFLLNACRVFYKRINDKGLRLECTIEKGLSATIRADGRKMTRIMLILLDNGVKYTDSGLIKVKVSRGKKYEKTSEIGASDEKLGEVGEESCDQRIILNIRIKDSGLGIGPQNLARLFQCFNQGDPSVARPYGGMGLGLAVAKEMTDLMGGEILVSSSLGIGTTVDLLIPVYIRGHLQNHDTNWGFDALYLNENKILSQSEKKHMPQFKPGTVKILLVEDNEINQKIATALLRKMNISLVSAHDGIEALELMEIEQFDLILMDIQMPRLDGVETTKIIREKGYKARTKKNNEAKDIPIIALTAHSLEYDREICMKAGMNDYLLKPVEMEKIFRVVKIWGPVIKNDDWDLEKLRDRMADDMELIIGVAKDFLLDLPRKLAELEENIKSENYEEMRRLSHTIKGAALNFEAIRLSETAAEIESATKRKDMPKIMELMAQLRENHIQLRELTNDFLTVSQV